MRVVLVFLFQVILITAFTGNSSPSSESHAVNLLAAKLLIQQSRYDQATNKLEVILEAEPNQPDALMFTGTIYLYHELDHLKAMKWFEMSLKLGGRAAFLVQHSHESLGGSQLADYCRGWLILRGKEIEFTPDNGTHGFSVSRSELQEFKQNRRLQSMFHIRLKDDNFNFRPSTGQEDEVLLIVAMYKKLSQSTEGNQ